MALVFELAKNAGIAGAPVADDGGGTICVLDEHKQPYVPIEMLLHTLVDDNMNPCLLAMEYGIDVLQVREVFRWLARIVDGMRVVEGEGD